MGNLTMVNYFWSRRLVNPEVIKQAHQITLTEGNYLNECCWEAGKQHQNDKNNANEDENLHL